MFYLHGTPASGLLDPRWEPEAQRQGIRLIGYDRPGVGLSSPLPGRRVADVVVDLAALADQLGASRFAVMGLSGGGPHALACAALLPSRCAAAASLASPAPPEFGPPESRTTRVNKEIRTEALPTIQEQERWKLEHREKDLKGTRSTLAGLEALASDRWTFRRGMFRLLLPHYVGRVEARALTGASARWASSSIRRALQPGIGGAQDDEIAIYHQPWGVDLGSIRVPVRLWHGEQDQFVRVSEGRWLASRIPGLETQFLPNDGHVSLAEYRIPEVLSWIRSTFVGQTA